LSDQKYFIELSLSLVFETSKKRKDDLIAKINECIQMMLEEEDSISVSSSVNAISEDQVFSIYSSALSEEEYN
jgi:F420-0:gamma-glutamyl ligase|tara:strand:- start:9367 stop:9585 length:219 start_codon:yes stop_codon:yes gene_type:complete